MFDDLCFGLGLKGESFGIFGRKYSGILSERQVVIEYFPPKMIQRALLNIYIDALSTQEFTISRRKPLLGSTKNRGAPCPEISGLPGDYKIYSEDCKKIFAIISKYEFKKALGIILSRSYGNTLKQVYFESDRMWLRQRYSRLSVEVLKDHIKNLLILANEVEDQ